MKVREALIVLRLNDQQLRAKQSLLLKVQRNVIAGETAERKQAVFAFTWNFQEGATNS